MQRVIGVVALLVVAVFGFFSWKATQIVPGPGVEALQRPECGHDWPESVKIGLIQPIADIPEFHDCQRFIVTSNEAQAYGPMAAIFASSELRNLEAQLQSAATASGRSGVAGGAPRPPAPGVPNIASPSAASPMASRAVPVGVIYADDVYDPLGIKAGLNCLYIYWISSGGPDTTWHARIVPEANASKCPTQSVTDSAFATTLEVRREVVKDPIDGQVFRSAVDYPPVARWDWDAKNGWQYVGIVCGNAWCEIGKPGFAPSPSLAVLPSDTKDERRVKLIKGWYDRQQLAYFDANGKLVPTQIVGTIIPDPALGTVSEMPDWVHVGDVWLESTSDADKDALKAYEKKFGFKKTGPDKPSRISIRDPGKSTEDEQLWESKIAAPGWLWLNDKHKRVMFRKTAATLDVPGVVRWRWMTLDEGTWARCPYGCCEVSYY